MYVHVWCWCWRGSCRFVFRQSCPANFDKEATGSFLSFCKNLRKYLMFPRKVLSCPVDVECGLGVGKWPAVMREVVSCDRLQGCLLFFHFQQFGHFIYLSISPCTSWLQSQMEVYLIFQFVLAAQHPQQQTGMPYPKSVLSRPEMDTLHTVGRVWGA